MALQNVATMMAEGVSLDGYTGRLSVFNMLDAVFAPAFPAALGKLVVVNLYEVEGEREPCWERVRVTDASGQLLAESISDLAGEGFAHRSMALFQGIHLEQPGEYVVTVEGASRSDGPWTLVRRRRFRAVLGPHPLARTREAEGGGAKMPGGRDALTE